MTRPRDQYNVPHQADHVHYRTHNGESFEGGYAWTETVSTASFVADNASVCLYWKPGSNEMHSNTEISAGGDCDAYLYINVTTGTTATATSITPTNHNQVSNKVSDVTMTYGTTGIIASIATTDSVTLWAGRFIPGGSGPNSQGGLGGDQEHEHIYAPGVGYALIVTNRSGSAIPMSLYKEWYEPGASS